MAEGVQHNSVLFLQLDLMTTDAGSRLLAQLNTISSLYP